jgi:hypothetical protein
MIDWDSQLTGLRWSGMPNESFVKRTGFLEQEEGTFMTQELRGLTGWAGVWAIEVEMHFLTSALRIEE